MSEHANWEQAVRALRERLLDICLDYEDTPVCARALFEALMVVITCGAPSPQAAKDVLKGRLSVPSVMSMQHGPNTGRRAGISR